MGGRKDIFARLKNLKFVKKKVDGFPCILVKEAKTWGKSKVSVSRIFKSVLLSPIQIPFPL